jgi:hypothetical protein
LHEHQLKAGNIGTIIDFVPHPSGREDGCVSEVFNAVGESVAVVTVSISAVEVFTTDENLSVRSLAMDS